MSKENTLQKDASRVGGQTKNSINPSVVLGIILLVGIGLRFFNLGTESYYIDEMFTVIEVRQSVHQLLTSGRLDQPPAYYLPFRLWVQIFGDAEAGTRSYSAVVGAGSIVLIYLLGRELFGKQVGLLAAALMSVTEFQIHYSQENRFYSFFEFMTLLSFLFFTLALKSKKIVYFFLYGLASVIMVYGHTYGVFILVAQNLFFIIQAFKNKSPIAVWITCQVLIALALLPYLAPLLFGTGGISGAVGLNLGGSPTPSLLDPIHFMLGYVLGHRHERSWVSVIVNFAAAGAFLVIGTWLYAAYQGRGTFLSALKTWSVDLWEIPDLRNKILLVGCWLLCPLVLPLIASLAIDRPMYEEHYTISATPAFYLLLSFGLFSVRKMIPILVSVGALAIMIMPGLSNYYETYVNEQWREAALYIEENSESKDVIVLAPNMGFGIQEKTFTWYYRGNLQDCGLSNTLMDANAISVSLKQCVSGYERFWVIIPDYPTVSSDDRFRSFFLDPNRTDMHKTAEQQFVGLSVYLFEPTK
jgi:4-amino-4-deoxy-L-arabinose transferase-like glycosyltransferase